MEACQTKIPVAKSVSFAMNACIVHLDKNKLSPHIYMKMQRYCVKIMSTLTEISEFYRLRSWFVEPLSEQKKNR